MAGTNKVKFVDEAGADNQGMLHHWYEGLRCSEKYGRKYTHFTRHAHPKFHSGLKYNQCLMDKCICAGQKIIFWL